MISLCVDDLVIAGTIDAVESVKAIMLGKYKMKDLGKIHLILGCEVLYDEATGDYSMNQRHYVIDLYVRSTYRLGELECRRLCLKRL